VPKTKLPEELKSPMYVIRHRTRKMLWKGNNSGFLYNQEGVTRVLKYIDRQHTLSAMEFVVLEVDVRVVGEYESSEFLGGTV